MLLLLTLLLAQIPASAQGVFTPVIAHPRGAPLDPRKADDLPVILDRVSAALIGRPYRLGPLGEGEDDDHPLYRTDVFDCTTFLETVMANAYCFPAGKSDCLDKRMREIRYGGSRVRFNERNHIPELDWLPNNEKRGFLESLDGTLFPGAWRAATVTIDRGLWLSMKTRAPRPDGHVADAKLAYVPVSYFFRKAELAPDAKAELEGKLAATESEIEKERAAGPDDEKARELDRRKFRVELDYLRVAYEPIEDRLAAIPSGTVLNLVRSPPKDAGRAKLTTLVSHQGLVLHTAKGLRIRHAAPNVKHVSDQSLADYLLRYVRSANYRGISLYRILPAN